MGIPRPGVLRTYVCVLPAPDRKKYCGRYHAGTTACQIRTEIDVVLLILSLKPDLIGHKREMDHYNVQHTCSWLRGVLCGGGKHQRRLDVSQVGIT